MLANAGRPPVERTTMSLSYLEQWNMELPELVEPGPNATEREVAEYVREVAGCEDIAPKPYALRYCKHRGFFDRPGFRVGQVLVEIDEIPIRWLRESLGPIQRDDWQWAGLAVPAYVERCPDLLWKMDRRTGDIFSFTAYCDSYLCSAGCAKRRAEADVDRACHCFGPAQPIWLAEMPFSRQGLRNISKRRSRFGGGPGLLWVHRGPILWVYSARDLSVGAKVEPKQGRWVNYREALEHLVGESLVLPVDGTRYLGSWKAPEPRPRRGRTFDLGRQPRDLVDDALADARLRLTAQYGPDALDRFTPEQVETIWLSLLQGCIDEEWKARKTDG